MFKRRRIIILGLAKSGYAAAKVLAKKKNRVIVTDMKNEDEIDSEIIEELEDLGVILYLGENPIELIDDSVDYIVKNPGIAIDHPYVVEAMKRGIPVINELELAYQLMPKEGITFIGITGTNGKTTTTTLIYEMIKESGRRVHLAGNIGYPLCSFLGKVKKGDIVVVETSCQQLENVDTYKPNIAVMTNISEAHLEFMKTYKHYKEVKKRIVQNQTSEDILIINDDCEELNLIKKNAKARKRIFSTTNQNATAYLYRNRIYVDDESIIALKDIKLIGKHNYENIMAAILAVKEVGVDKESIKRVLKTFMGVPHRLEYVNTINEVDFYNDTEATNIKCTQIALSSFDRPTLLLLGGYERGQDFNLLLPFMKNVKKVYTLGQTKERVKDFCFNNNIDVSLTDTLEEAMKEIFKELKKGEVVLLSPASASWDQYKRCEDRGDEFKYLINEEVKTKKITTI